MTTLIIGTTNPAKIAQLQGALASLDISVDGVRDRSQLPTVVEDGTTALENARTKALAYARALGRRVLSIDNALFLDGLAPGDQPGVHVRRIGGGDAATDEDLLTHSIALIASLGESVTGYWEYGVCIAKPDGTFAETTLRTPRVFTSKRSSTMVPGYPLESIQIDPESGRYISEMSPNEQAAFWQRTLGEQLCAFVREHIDH